MKRIVSHRLLLVSLVGALLVVLMWPNGEANGQLSNPEGWIDKLTTFVVIEKVTEQEGNFDRYLAQIRVMRTVFKKEWTQGDLRGTYAAMNGLMDMLQARAGDIRPEAAQAIWDYCYQVTPIALHDAQRYPIVLEFKSQS